MRQKRCASHGAIGNRGNAPAEPRSPREIAKARTHRNLHGSIRSPRSAQRRFGYGTVTRREVGYAAVTFLR